MLLCLNEGTLDLEWQVSWLMCRLKSSIPKSGTVWFELQQKKAEIAV